MDFSEPSITHSYPDSGIRRIHHDDYYRHESPARASIQYRNFPSPLRHAHSDRWDSNEGIARSYREEITPALPAGMSSEVEYDAGLTCDSLLSDVRYNNKGCCCCCCCC